MMMNTINQMCSQRRKLATASVPIQTISTTFIMGRDGRAMSPSTQDASPGRLPGTERQPQTSGITAMSFDERLAILVDH